MPDLRKSAREQSGLCVLVRELVHVRVCAEGLQERPGPGPARPRQAAVTPPAGLSCWVCSHGAFLLLLRGLAAPCRPDARPDALR